MSDEETQQAPAEQPAEQQTEQPKAEGSWRDQLPTEYKDAYPEFKNVEDFVKGYDHLSKKLGNSVSLPKEDSPKEEWDKVFNKLGRPESPDKYEVSAPEDLGFDNSFVDKFKQKAHEVGATNTQAKELFSWYTKEVEQAEQQQQKQLDESMETLKGRWGNEFDSRLNKVQSFAKQLSKEDYFPKIEKYGNDPDFVDMMYNLANKYATEERLVKPEDSVQSTPNYKEAARKIMSEPDYKFSLDKQQKVRDLYKKVAELQEAKK